MSQLDIKIRKLQDNGSTFRANIETLYLGGVRSAKVDELRFELPEEWKTCTVTLHVQRLSGTKPDPQLLDEQNSALVDRRWTLEKEGTWMLLAINDSGYIAMTKPGKYTCYDTIDTDTTTENITPSIYEQFVAEVTKYAKQALESMNAAKTSETAAQRALQDTETEHTAALQDIARARTTALNDVAASTKTATTAAKTATQQATAAAGSASTAVTKAGEAEKSKTAAATSATNAKASEEASKNWADEAKKAANTDPTVSIKGAPADAAATRALIEESLAAQRAEDYARIKFWASNDPTSPASFIGGTWERIEGEFIMGASSAYPVGTTGGSATHTQTVAEMPSHSHSGSTGSAGSHSHSAWTGGAGGHSHTVSAAVTQKHEVGAMGVGGADGSGTYGYSFSSGTATTSWVGDHTHGVGMNEAGAHTHTVSIGSTGSGQAMNILNPYYAVYIWVRVDDAA